MNAIVLIALKRPYTFIVLAILILIFGGRAALNTPTDIFPNIGIPVVAVVWTYNGLTPEDMSGRVIYYYERSLTTTVGNIEHIESQSLYGRGIVKIYFQPGTECRGGPGAGHGRFTNRAEADAGGDHTAAGSVLQRLVRPGARAADLLGSIDGSAAV
jgi:hypothetical protein